MKNIVAILVGGLLSLSVQAQTSGGAVTFNPQKPQQGKGLDFEYVSKATAPQANLKAVVVQGVNDGMVRFISSTVTLVKKSNKWLGNVQLDNGAATVAIAIEEEGAIKDSNAGKGFTAAVYQNGTMVKGANALMALLYQQGDRRIKVEPDLTKALALMTQDLRDYPELNKLFFGSYVNLLKKSDPEKGFFMAEAAIKQYEQKANLTEEDYGQIIGGYYNLNRKNSADSLTQLVMKRFPKGTTYGNSLYGKLIGDLPLDYREKYSAEYLEITAGKKEADVLHRRSLVRIFLAQAYMKKFDTANFKAALNAEVADNLRIYNYYQYANLLISERRQLADAEMLAQETVQWMDQEYAKDALPKGAEKDQFMMAYILSLNTYANVLGLNGKNTEAYAVAKRAALDVMAGTDYMSNQIYVDFAVKTKSADEAKAIIIDVVKKGQANEAVRGYLKALYVKEKGTADNFEPYLKGLESEFREKKKAALREQMISIAGPDFSLTDMEGNTYSLASLKGKVVVLDFWATWCGPCIKSFPSMIKTQQKFSKDENVVFLFVNCWEKGDVAENIKAFLKENPQFSGLKMPMDIDNNAAKAYKAASIPRKVILDGEGNQRFVVNGFSGKDEETIEELSLMVELAKQSK